MAITITSIIQDKNILESEAKVLLQAIKSGESSIKNEYLPATFRSSTNSNLKRNKIIWQLLEKQLGTVYQQIMDIYA